MTYKSKCQTSLKLSNNNTNSITVSASEQYSRATMNELQFGKGEKLQIKYRNKESGWCFGENKATKESGWISEDFISEKHKLDHLDVDKWQFCKCSGFVPNAFRPTLCKECFHNKNSHDEA
ncbi:hypothetical protein MHBO_004646 [Bonamia ostreae]|uniref:SH3 domain-containing protein n=1 Tax=Bonamia ostreae TaxID=126728 RepID=A0ABV2ATW1_9EUKA